MFGLCAITHPPTLINVRKMVGYVDLKDILQISFKNNPRIFVFYMIFDWLSVSFRKAVKLRDWFYG